MSVSYRPLLGQSNDIFWDCYKCHNVNRPTENNCLKCGCSMFRIGHTEAHPYGVEISPPNNSMKDGEHD